MAVKMNVEIAKVKRLVNTLSGGPRYRFTFADGSVYQTKPDSMFSYAISPDRIEGGTFDVTLEDSKITDLERSAV